jgi:hypothetical protein
MCGRVRLSSDYWEIKIRLKFADPLANEAEEQRRKRLLAQQQSWLLPQSSADGISPLAMIALGGGSGSGG